MREPFKDEHNILARFQQGDHAAFKLVFDRFYKRLCYYTEGLTEDEAEGQLIATNSFLKLYAKCKDFNSLNHIVNFLYITSKNDCLNYLRGQKRFQKKLQDYLYLQDDQVVELETLESEVVKIIHAAVESLPTQCRRVVEMLFYKGMKYSAIAIEMGIEEATVRAQKRRAMTLLRERLGNQEFWLFLLLLCGGIVQHIIL